MEEQKRKSKRTEIGYQRAIIDGGVWRWGKEVL